MEQLPQELIHSIVIHIVDGVTWKSMLFTCSRIYQIMHKMPHQDTVTNHLVTLLRLLPNELWEYSGLSINPNLRIEHVLAFPDQSWNYDLLSSNECASLADLQDDRLFHTDYYEMYANPNVDPQMLLCNKLFGRCCCNTYSDERMTGLSLNFRLTLDDINQHINAKWCYYNLSFHPSVTLDVMVAQPHRRWDYSVALLNPNITFDMIMAHRELLEEASSNDNRSWSLSMNRSITIQNVIDHPELPWFYSHLSRHVNITLQMMLDHPELPWRFDYASANPNITYRMMLDHPNIKWSYLFLSLNPNITYSIVKNNLQAPWDYPYLSLNLFNKHNRETYSQTVARTRCIRD